MTNHREPTADSPKGKVLSLGLRDGGGSIQEAIDNLGCRDGGNVMMHIWQCHDNFGFDIEVKNDRFHISGNIPKNWKRRWL